ncbi:MAG: hypothetical protein OEX02_19220 [Cyclobacteriaceae bacterium]|nr:hypothetical protein [Cyclobacteriaceae bacterium]
MRACRLSKTVPIARKPNAPSHRDSLPVTLSGYSWQASFGLAPTLRMATSDPQVPFKSDHLRSGFTGPLPIISRA